MPAFKRASAALAAASLLTTTPAPAHEPEGGPPHANRHASAEVESPPLQTDTAGPPEQAPTALGDDEPTFSTTVRARLDQSSASSATVRERDFLLRPRRRAADLLQVTPGLLVLQHAGGGKANQYFMRGFDLDHGTDVAITLDGIPVNMVSHAHGQGYADMNWIIPETIERIEVTKGPYFANVGDFGLAGAVNLVTRDSFSQSGVTLTAGRFDTYRGLIVASGGEAMGELGWKPFLAAEIYATNGPFIAPEKLTRFNLFGKLTRDLDGVGSLSLGLTSSGAGWNGSGQLPLRAVESGEVSRFGTLDPFEGGGSQRHNAFLSYRLVPDADSEFTALAYLSQYRLNLYSNFTLFSRDPVHGDEILQHDDRVFGGFALKHRKLRRWNDAAFDTSIGVQGRSDSISNGLFNTQQRLRREDVVRDEVREGSLGVWVQEDIRWTPWLRTVVGVRADLFGFEVMNRLAAPPMSPDTSTGVRQAVLASPKGSVILSPSSSLDVFLNGGRGFHSNDARGVVRPTDPVTPLTAGVGAEIGARWWITKDIHLAAVAWGLDLESELVWIGDEGTTEAVGPTRRLGLDFEARARILPWLFAEGDLSLAKATFVENAGSANSVALAPLVMGTAGVAARHPNGFFGRLGFKAIASRPATEDRFLTAEGWALFDLVAGYRGPWFEVTASVENLTNTDWREAQFATVSRLSTDPSRSSPPPANACPAKTRTTTDDVGNFAGCEDIHFTPGWPINPQVSFTAYF
jgi:outer membrane receptor protein involved in Fe transport